MNRIQLVTLLSAVMLFTACDNDKSSSADKSNEGEFQEVQTMDDMGRCTKSHYGKIVRVLENDSVFECTSNGWIAIESPTDEFDFGQTEPTGSDTAAIENKKVDSVSISGFAQKGPFLNGTAITLYGLDSALSPTKTKFTGKVVGDSGLFSISNIVLDKQYAVLEVNGFFKNANNGKNTSGTKTKLSALVNMADSNVNVIKKSTSNINVMTELERLRAVYLVNNKKYNVPSAKQQATRELLNLAGMPSNIQSQLDGLTATEISLSSGGDSATALYTLSVMLQGNQTLPGFQSKLKEIGEAFAKTGNLRDPFIRVEIADRLNEIDSTDGFAAIRENIKAMHLGKVPNFEEYLYKFWVHEYGLPNCSDENETSLAKVINKESNRFGAGFVCTSKRWHRTTDLDTELGLCLADKEGEFAKSKANKYYTCKNGSWTNITETQYELKACTDTTKTPYVHTKTDEYFACYNKQWISIDIVTFNLKLCTENRESEYESFNNDYYRCNGEDWDKKTALDYELDEKNPCSKEQDGKVIKAEADGSFHVCDNGHWNDADNNDYTIGYACNASQALKQEKIGENFFSCNGEKWSEITELDYELTTVNPCIKEKEGKVIKAVADGSFHTCTNETWEEANEIDFIVGYVCNESKATNQESAEGKYYNCDGKAWSETTQDFYEIGLCNEDNNNSCAVAATSGNYYECSNKQWTIKDEFYCTYGLCIDGKQGNHGNLNGKDYYCDKSEWMVCGPETVYSILEATTENVACVIDQETSSYLWRKATEYEVIAKSVCNEKNKAKSSSDWFFYNENKSALYCIDDCDEMMCAEGTHSYEWLKASTAEVATGLRCNASIGNTIKNGYTCEYSWDDLEYMWREASAGEIALNKRCTGAIVNTIESATKNGETSYFACVDDGHGSYTWRGADAYEITGKAVCNESIKGKVVSTGKDKGIVCEPSTIKWREATANEANAGKLCTEDNLREVIPQTNLFGLFCDPQNTAWEIVSFDGARFLAKKYCWNGELFSLENDYVCDSIMTSANNADYYWRDASIFEKELGKACSPTLYNQYGTFSSVGTVKGMSVKCARNTARGTHYYYSASYKDTRTNETYHVASIANNVWILRDMNYDTGKSKCYSNCTARRLYTLSDALYKVCPSGWTLPDTSAFSNYKGSLGKDLMTSSYGGDNIYGFSAEPVYYYNITSNEYMKIHDATFWATWTKAPTYLSYGEYLGWGIAFSTDEKWRYTRREDFLEGDYLPVRCVLKE